MTHTKPLSQKMSKKTKQPPLSTVRGQCPQCGKSPDEKDTPVGEPVVTAISGEYHGKPYTSIVTSRVQCSDCGQLYFVKNYKL